MRFQDGVTEAAFVASRTRSLIRGILLLSSISSVMCFFALVYMVAIAQNLSRSKFPTDDAYMIHLVQIGSLAAIFALLMMVMGICLWVKLPAIMGPKKLEIITVVLMCVLMATVVLSSPPELAKMFGGGEVYFSDRYASDSGMLMTVDGMVTAAHLGLPVRWHVMITLEVAAIAFYMAIVFIVGSNEPMENAIFNLVFLTGMVVATGMGKRIVEANERAAFRKIIEEKQLRCEAEFKLSVAETRHERYAPEAQLEVASEYRPRSQVESLPASTFTGKLFDALGQDGVDPEAQLARVAEMGKSEHWWIDPVEITMEPGKVLGRGGFGIVVEGVFCGMRVAVKRPREELDSASLSKLSGLANELRVLRHVRHPNIVLTHGAVIDPQRCRIALVLELVNGTILDVFVTGNGSVDAGVSAQFQIMYGVCLALLYMHTRNPQIVHGDIKGNNIMIEVCGDKVTPKLLDFGLSRIVTRNTRPLGGTLAWMAPEVLLKSGPVRCSADVYSFGCLIAFVATSTPLPMSGWRKKKVMRTMQSGTVPTPTWPQGCPLEPSCKSIVDCCLEISEPQRPSMMNIHRRLRSAASTLGLERHLADLLPSLASCSERNSEEAAEQPQRPHSATPPVEEASEAAHAEEGPVQEMPVEVARGARTPPQLRFVHPQMMPTQDIAMKATLLDLIMRWNAEVPARKSCCSFHACVHKAIEIADGFRRGPCYEGSWPAARKQCHQCGLVDYSGDKDCPVCGRLVSATNLECSAVSGPRMQL